jgi:CheY-like chemotaxis protein
VTVAILDLPLFALSVATQETQERVHADRKMRVLVVDDEQIIADSVARILRQFDFDATAVYGGAAALQALSTGCPDVLLSDVVMPEINGVELAVAVQEKCPRTRIMLFSGQAATADLLKRAGDLGHTFELLPKPLHPEKLLKALRS